jgi:hypothetical protein
MFSFIINVLSKFERFYFKPYDNETFITFINIII